MEVRGRSTIAVPGPAGSVTSSSPPIPRVDQEFLPSAPFEKNSSPTSRTRAPPTECEGCDLLPSTASPLPPNSGTTVPGAEAVPAPTCTAISGPDGAGVTNSGNATTTTTTTTTGAAPEEEDRRRTQPSMLRIEAPQSQSQLQPQSQPQPFQLHPRPVPRLHLDLTCLDPANRNRRKIPSLSLPPPPLHRPSSEDSADSTSSGSSDGSSGSSSTAGAADASQSAEGAAAVVDGRPTVEPPPWATAARGEARLEPVCESVHLQAPVDLTTRPCYRIGRSPNSDLQLLHNASSRRHALLFHHPNGNCYVVDCGSAHGTYVDGVRVRSAVAPCPSSAAAGSGVNAGSASDSSEQTAASGMVIPHRVRRGALLRFGGPGAPSFVLKSFSVGLVDLVKELGTAATATEATKAPKTPKADTSLDDDEQEEAETEEGRVQLNTRLNALGSRDPVRPRIRNDADGCNDNALRILRQVRKRVGEEDEDGERNGGLGGLASIFRPSKRARLSHYRTSPPPAVPTSVITVPTSPSNAGVDNDAGSDAHLVSPVTVRGVVGVLSSPPPAYVQKPPTGGAAGGRSLFLSPTLAETPLIATAVSAVAGGSSLPPAPPLLSSAPGGGGAGGKARPSRKRVRFSDSGPELYFPMAVTPDELSSDGGSCDEDDHPTIPLAPTTPRMAVAAGGAGC